MSWKTPIPEVVSGKHRSNKVNQLPPEKTPAEADFTAFVPTFSCVRTQKTLAFPKEVRYNKLLLRVGQMSDKLPTRPGVSQTRKLWSDPPWVRGFGAIMGLQKLASVKPAS